MTPSEDGDEMSAPKGFRRYRGWIAAGVLLVIAGTAYVLLRGNTTSSNAVTYQTEKAQLGTISVTVSGTGNVQVDGTTDVYPAVSGTVATVPVAQGSTVTTGAVLFTLDKASAEANTAKALASLRQAQQGVAQSKLQITKAENNLAALQARATDPNANVTSADINAAAGDVSVAKAGLAAAQAQVTTAQLSYNDAKKAEGELTVTAPCSGVVYTLNIAAGDSVSPKSGGSNSASSASAAYGAGSSNSNSSSSSSSTAPVVIAPAQPLAVHLSVNEVDLPSLKLGQRADIQFDALPKITATGKVYDIDTDGSVSSGVVTFDVWVSLDAADPELRSGMSAAATIVTNIAKDALIVSNSAVHSDGSGGYYVEVMKSGSSTPTKVTVQTGLVNSTQTQILSGIAEGDTVVSQSVSNTTATTTGTQRSGGFMLGGAGGPRD